MPSSRHLMDGHESSIVLIKWQFTRGRYGLGLPTNFVQAQ